MPRKHGDFTSRTKARKRAADVVFEAAQRNLLQPERLKSLLSERVELVDMPSPLPDYAQQIVAGIADSLPEIDRLIEAKQRKGGLDRLPPVDLAIMRVAVWEMLYNSDVDAIVAIDEAVAISKAISTDQSPSLVNAILDAIRAEIGTVRVEDSEEVEADYTDETPGQDDLDELLGEY